MSLWEIVDSNESVPVEYILSVIVWIFFFFFGYVDSIVWNSVYDRSTKR